MPHVNRLVTQLDRSGLLCEGAAIHVGHAAVVHHTSLDETFDGLISGRITFGPLKAENIKPAREFAEEACARRWAAIRRRLDLRDELRSSLPNNPAPLAYVLTATGDVCEDVRHAEAVARHGGDIVAVIRSTAQSLLDYVPYGPTREGYGGTFATQENLNIMRAALDANSRALGEHDHRS